MCFSTADSRPDSSAGRCAAILCPHGHFRDSNGDLVQDPWEAYGEYTNNPLTIAGPVTGIDIILDDPTLGLDPMARREFIEGMIAVLAEGKVLATGTMAQMQDVDHPWVQAYFKGPRARAALAQKEAI